MAAKKPIFLALATGLAFGATSCRTHEGPVKEVCADTGDPCTSDADCSSGVSCIDADEYGLVVILKPLGFLSQRAFPGDEVPLKVVALRSAGANIDAANDLKPLVGEVVVWSIIGDASDATLSSDASLTSADGIATISVNTGTAQGVGFQVQAKLAGANPVNFSFDIRVDKRVLKLLTPSNVDTVVNRRERLRVQLLRPVSGGLGVPVANETLRVEMVGGERNGAGLEPNQVDVADIQTSLTGIATIRFLTGTLGPTSYQITFCPRMSCTGVPPQTITLQVAPGGNSTGCQSFTDCEPGYVCNAGNCELAATYCDGDNTCPPGYVCGAGRVCVEASQGTDCSSGCAVGEICGSTEYCIVEDGCLNSADCGLTFVCNPVTGACNPDPTSGDPVINVSGDWLTRYHFDISDTLPGFFTNGLGPVVDFLDLIFRSQLEINIPIIGNILEALLDQLIAEYVPDWVITVVTVLADFIHLFENMDVEGEMTLYQDPDPGGPPAMMQVDLWGEEDWTSAIFYVASFCPGGVLEYSQSPIPTCGQVDVIMYPTVNVDYSNNDPDVGVNVKPFSGRVAGQELQLFGREVDLGLSQLINVLLDVIVTVASNGQWYDFEDFLSDIVPCADLQYAIDDLACDITDGSVCSIPGIEIACQAFADAAIDALTDELGGIQLRVLELDFDATAVIHDDGDSTQPYAIRLGDPNDPAAESSITGDTQGIGLFSGDFDANSWWYGER